MKKLFLFFALLVPLVLLGQGNTYRIGGGGALPANIYYNSPNLGIGTSSPVSLLTIKESTSAPTLSTEKIVNGNFTNNLIGWTDTANWSYSAGKALHATGNISALTQSITLLATSYYVVSVTTSAIGAGTVVMTFGAMAGTTTISANTTTYYTFLSTTAGAYTLTFTPTSTFNGKLDDVSVKYITTTSPAGLSLLNSDASFGVEYRAGGIGLGSTTIGYLAGGNNYTGTSLTAIGYRAGKSNATGIENTFIGTSAGLGNYSGSQNSALGMEAGYGLVTGSYNTFLGWRAGFVGGITGSYNIGLGAKAGYIITTGSSNMYIGYNTGVGNATGASNVVIGDAAGSATANYSFNTMIGKSAGLGTTGNQNVFIGYHSGLGNTSGTTNVYVGQKSGYSNSTGSGNVAIGDSAGYANTGSNQLFIHNGPSTTPLIGGDFSTGVATITYCLKLTPIAAPTWTPAEGQIYMDTDHHLYVYNGTTWVQLDN